MRRIAVAAVASLALVVTGMALAPGAHAAASPTTVQYTCIQPFAPLYVLNSSAAGVSALSGDTVTVDNQSGGAITFTLLPSGTTVAGGNTVASGQQAVMTFGLSGGQVQATGGAGNCNTKTATFMLTITGSGGGGGAPSSDTSASSAPAPVMQQFGKPSSGTCDAAAPVSLNWGGAGSGGWGESWAQWMNGGLGGTVCTRTLVYSDALGAWTGA